METMPVNAKSDLAFVSVMETRALFGKTTPSSAATLAIEHSRIEKERI